MEDQEHPKHQKEVKRCFSSAPTNATFVEAIAEHLQSYAKTTAVFLTAGALAVGVSGCGVKQPKDNWAAGKESVYCVEKGFSSNPNDMRVVDDDRCNDRQNNHGNYFFYRGGYSGTSYQPGTVLTNHGGMLIDPYDSAARKSAGLPESGKIVNGSTSKSYSSAGSKSSVNSGKASAGKSGNSGKSGGLGGGSGSSGS